MTKFFIKTYGCQANRADSLAIENYLDQLNCLLVKKESDADLIIVNSCAIRQKAEDKLFSYLGFIEKKIRPFKFDLKVIVIGCVATYKKDEIYKRFSSVKFVLSAKEDINKLRNYLSDVVASFKSMNKIWGGKTNASSCSLSLGGILKSSIEVKKSLINIMIGCNNYCSYCIVPFTKGRERSYLAKGIVSKIKEDVENGSKEIILLGQNVTSYKDPDTGKSFDKLLDDVAQINGDFWVRFLSPHPKDLTKDVLYTIKRYPKKLCPYIHHPLQSGSNKVLKAMNRTYTREIFLGQIEWIKEILPSPAISTDIIVAFPGESLIDYEETLDVINKVKFDNIYPFIYSKRKFTKAALLEDEISKADKIDRINRLIKLQADITLMNNRKKIGKTLTVLVEKRVVNGKLLARTQGNNRVFFDGDDRLIGRFVDVEIVGASPADLKAIFLAA